jgi:hypothetical protein
MNTWKKVYVIVSKIKIANETSIISFIESSDVMSLVEFLGRILTKKELELINSEPIFLFNLEDFEVTKE